MHSLYLPRDMLAGETALVTGAGSGINQGIARMFAAHGARVVMIGRRQEKLDETREMIEKAGGEAVGFSADVRDADAMAEAAQQGAERFGPYEIVVAGAAGNFLAPAEKISSNGFSAVVDIDLKGTFHTFKAALPHLAGSNVKMLAITAPQSQMPMPYQAHVCAAKAAVDMLVKTLAIEWGKRGVRVNALSPGYVAGTVGGDLLAADKGDEIRHRLPLGRFSMVDEMAQMAMLMVSPLTNYMTGQIVALDGGVSLLGGSAMLDLAGA